MTTPTSIITLGNGQLGLMLGKAAKKLGIPFEALSISDAWAWLEKDQLANALVTFEQEHVDPELLKKLQCKGVQSFPSWCSFHLLRSKRSQKAFLQQHHFPSSPFLTIQNWGATEEEFCLKNGGGVLKAGRGGYDGKGVWVLDRKGVAKTESAADLCVNIAEPYLEKLISFDYEIAAVVCRSASGQMLLYPTVKSIQQDGVCFQVEYTKEFSDSAIAQKAGEIAKGIAEKLNYVGVLAVEFFVSGTELLVNEIAPRVHNSGHFTIDVCEGNQFENHLLAGLGRPLMETEPSHKAAIMVNLLWPDSEKEFAPLFTRLTCGPEWPANSQMHWYGKSEIRSRRKMGHFTVYGSDIEKLRSQAKEIFATRWA